MRARRCHRWQFELITTPHVSNVGMQFLEIAYSNAIVSVYLTKVATYNPIWSLFRQVLAESSHRDVKVTFPYQFFCFSDT